jgi:hypothetical protein
MPITEADIKLVESERMADTTDGGGRRTTNVVPDGVAGNVFPKVSRLDSVYGRVNLRKVFGWVDTGDLDVYAGAHAIITDAPDNERIHATIFSMGSDFDTRTQARDRIESYVIAGPESRMRLYGRQLSGQQAVAAYQRVEEPLPEIGEVVCLSREQGGVTIYQQFIRITDLTHEVRTFEDNNGDFQRRVITLKTSAVLRYEFVGDDPPVRVIGSGSATSRVRVTTVADASRYYGIQPLTAAVDSGALELSAASVYTPLVPTTQRETAVALAEISGASRLAPASSVQITERTTQTSATGTMTWRTRRAIYPGSLEFVHDGTNNSEHYDDGQGGVVFAATGLVVGSVVYDTGVVSHQSIVAGGTGVLATYTPAAQVSQPAHTRQIPITLATRGTVYAETLLPVPAPGTAILDYRALGRWYRLRDIGGGQMRGDDLAYGTGTIDYVTGALVITLGALPDVGSSILLAWGSPVHTRIRTGAGASAPVWRYKTADDEDIVPESVSITWEADSVTKTATDDGDGYIVGDATGVVSYSTGELWFTPLVLPDPSTAPLLEYETGGPVEETFTPTADGNGMVTCTLAGAPVVPQSVEIIWQTVREKTTGERSGETQLNATYQVVPAPMPTSPTAPPGVVAEPVRPLAPNPAVSGNYLPRVTEYTNDPNLFGVTRMLSDPVRGPYLVQYVDASLRTST